MTMIEETPTTSSTTLRPLTIIVPSFNESENVDELIGRLDGLAFPRHDTTVLYVDDSSDDTPERVVRAGRRAQNIRVKIFHRVHPIGGLSGAVIEGICAAHGDVVVMDADLQHPPELIPELLDALTGVDLVVASRYLELGSHAGLPSRLRVVVSRASTSVAKFLFPHRLSGCSDPMTGFFAFRRDAVDVTLLRPHGFKILLEILASHQLHVSEIPFVFGHRFGGHSKASMRQGCHFLAQLLHLRIRH